MWCKFLLDLVHLPWGSCATNSKWLTLEELRGLVGDVNESEPSEPHEATASDDGLTTPSRSIRGC